MLPSYFGVYLMLPSYSGVYLMLPSCSGVYSWCYLTAPEIYLMLPSHCVVYLMLTGCSRVYLMLLSYCVVYLMLLSCSRVNMLLPRCSRVHMLLPSCSGEERYVRKNNWRIRITTKLLRYRIKPLYYTSQVFFKYLNVVFKIEILSTRERGTNNEILKLHEKKPK